MFRMVQSSEEPQLIQIDWGKYKNGKVDILVHWNIQEKTREDEMGSYTYWEYDEVRMRWVLPIPMSTRSEVQTYFDNNYNQGENILAWAQASKMILT